jgi:plasmid stabilization system protein ParE
MRRIVFAPSFDRELEEIGFYIEEQFGEEVRRYFIGDIAATCSVIADFPGIGKTAHGYDTHLAGFVFR